LFINHCCYLFFEFISIHIFIKLISAASVPNQATVAATGEQIQARGPHRVPGRAALDVAVLVVLLCTFWCI